MNVQMKAPKSVAYRRQHALFYIPVKDLDIYRAAVERLAESRSPEVFRNGQPEHAAIIFETFLKFAKTRVVIFCEKLCKEVFARDSISTAIEAAIRKGVQVDIIAQEQPESDELVRHIEKWKSDSRLKISFVQARPPISDMEANFATMDGEAYRFEPERSHMIAHASMFNPRLASSLENVFFRLQSELV